MTKGDLVVELGDESCAVGVYTGARFKTKLGIRWHAKCFRWVARSQLRLANPQEVVSYNYLHSSNIKTMHEAPYKNSSQLNAYNIMASLLCVLSLAGCDQLWTGPHSVYAPPCPIITDTVWSSGQVIAVIHTQVGTGYCIIK